MSGGRQQAITGKQPAWLAWLLPALLLGFVAVSLWHSFDDQIKETETRTLTLARAVEQHATATIDRTSLALSSVILRTRPSDLQRDTLSPERRKALTDMLAAQHRQTRGVVSMSLTDADGIVIANSVGTPPGVDLSQRRYFQDLKTGTADGIAVSEVIKGKVSNKWGLQVARRIDLPDRRFGGMVVANLGLRENFEGFYETLDVGPNGLITLRAQDNTVLVRYPSDEAVLGKTVRGSQGTQAVSEGVMERITRSVSPVDHIDRILVVRKLPDYAIYAVVGVSYHAAVMAWLKDSAAMIVISLILLPLSAFVAIMIKHRFDMLQELRTLSSDLETTNRELVEAKAESERLSLQDQLTGAWNRRYADMRMVEALGRAQREGIQLSLLLLDLDHFKNVNDQKGHQAGDQVLIDFVRLIQGRLRVNDVFARWGGEEFILLLEQTSAEGVQELANQLRRTVVDHCFPVIGHLTVSIGIAHYRTGLTLDEMMSRADRALYAAKNGGRNRVAVADEPT